MKKKRIRLAALLAALALCLGAAGCNKEQNDGLTEKEEPESSNSTASTATVRDDGRGLNGAEHWIAKLDAREEPAADVQGFNDALSADSAATGCVDLFAMADTIGRAELTAMLDEAALPEDDRYIGASKVTADYYQKLTANMNKEGVQDQNDVGYGFAVRNELLRTFPTADPSYEIENDLEFDLFAETRLGVFEPLRVLHPSADGKWLYVQSANYRAWIAADAVATTDRAEWERYAAPERPLVVTGNRVTLNENVYNSTASGLELFMGTVLPMLDSPPATIDGMSSGSGRAVLLPRRGENGRLETVQALVPWNADVSEGYLPYTRENILRQAFKLVGDRHGWSGMNKSRDTSSVITDVFASFGFRLPRNSSSQAAMPGESVDLTGMSDEKKAQTLASQPAGSLVLMDGHVALYVGEENGTPYVLHSLYVTYGGGGEEQIVNAIVVTDLSLIDTNGNTYLSGVHSVRELR